MKRYRSLSELPEAVQRVVRAGQTRTTGLRCPECDGGRSHENSLGVYRIGDELIIKCYRIKCQHFGKLWLSEGEAPPALINGFEPRPYLGALVSPALNPNAVRWVWDRYSISQETLRQFGVSFVLDFKGVYMPVRGPMGSDRGGIVRRFDGWGNKADSYKTADEPWQSWYRRLHDDGTPGTVLVEDQLSAMRAWQLGYNAVALLGAAVSPDRAPEIERHAARPIQLALDADAFSTACGIAKRYSWIDRVVLLENDLKDVSDDEILARLE